MKRVTVRVTGRCSFSWGFVHYLLTYDPPPSFTHDLFFYFISYSFPLHVNWTSLTLSKDHFFRQLVLKLSSFLTCSSVISPIKFRSPFTLVFVSYFFYVLTTVDVGTRKVV